MPPFFPTGPQAKSARSSNNHEARRADRDTRSHRLPDKSDKYKKRDLDDVLSIWSYDEEHCIDYISPGSIYTSAQDFHMPAEKEKRHSAAMGAKPSHDVRKTRTRSETEQTREQFAEMNMRSSRVLPIYQHCFVLRKHGMTVKLGGYRGTNLATGTTTTTPAPSIDSAIGIDPCNPTDRDCHLIDQAIQFIISNGGEIEIPPLNFDSDSSSLVSDDLPSTPKNTGGQQEFSGHHSVNGDGYGNRREEHPGNARNMPQTQNRYNPPQQQPFFNPQWVQR
jgi:hypothetical protein